MSEKKKYFNNNVNNNDEYNINIELLVKYFNYINIPNNLELLKFYSKLLSSSNSSNKINEILTIIRNFKFLKYNSNNLNLSILENQLNSQNL